MNVTTGERIKARRKALGMSAETLAAKLNVSPATMYRYEKGDIEKVPAAILNPLSEALQTTPEYLMGWRDNPNEAYLDNEYVIKVNNPETRVLAQGFDKLPESERKRGIEMARLIFAAYADLFKEGNDET